MIPEGGADGVSVGLSVAASADLAVVGAVGVARVCPTDVWCEVVRGVQALGHNIVRAHKTFEDRPIEMLSPSWLGKHYSALFPFLFPGGPDPAVKAVNS